MVGRVVWGCSLGLCQHSHCAKELVGKSKKQVASLLVCQQGHRVVIGVNETSVHIIKKIKEEDVETALE